MQKWHKINYRTLKKEQNHPYKRSFLKLHSYSLGAWGSPPTAHRGSWRRHPPHLPRKGLPDASDKTTAGPTAAREQNESGCVYRGSRQQLHHPLAPV